MTVIILQVGERRFTTTQATLTDGSGYFAAQFSGSWRVQAQADGSLFIDRDGNLFAHILAYLRSGVLPLFYDQRKGHDHAMYQKLLSEAKYYQIEKIQDFVEGRKYIQAVKIVRTAHLTDNLNDICGIDDPDTAVQYFPTWKNEKVYLCPRQIGSHRGDSRRCGRQCMNARGEGGVEYEDDMVLHVLEVRSKTCFNKEFLTE